MSVEQRFIVIGLDGATFDFIDYWVEKGALPNFEKLMGKGERAVLESTTPPISPVAWASFLTGTNPGKHGVFGFTEGGFTDFGIVNSRSLEEDYFWQHLDEDLRTAAIGIPMTYPPKDIDGYLLSGFLSAGENVSYPPEFVEEMEEKTGEYKIDIDSNPKEGGYDKFVKELEELFENRREIFFHVMEEKDVNLLMTVFMSTDRASHFLWSEAFEEDNWLLDHFRKVDSFLGEVLERKGDSTDLIVMSDHGFGKMEKVVNLNNLFIENGWIEFDGSWSRLKYQAFRRGFHPRNIYRWISRLRLAWIVDRLNYSDRFKNVDRVLSFRDVDLDRSSVMSKGKGNIYLNKEAIESQGREFEYFREEVREVLESLEDPDTGEKIVKEVLEGEDIFEGHEADRAPDLVAVMSEEYTSHPLFASDGEVITRHVLEEKDGKHEEEGIFIGIGPSFEGVELPDRVRITDIAPTILKRFGTDKPEGMDGEDVL